MNGYTVSVKSNRRNKDKNYLHSYTMLVSIMSVSLLSYHIPWQAAELSFEQFATILDSTIEITLSRQWGKETKEKFL